MPDLFEDIDALLRGSIDMHLHHGPLAQPTRYDAIELAEQAQEAGMRAVVLKNSYYPTAHLATMLKKRIPGIEIIGSVCLDFSSGGLNHFAAKSAAQLGARVLWMPTYAAANSIDKMRVLGLNLDGEGISILDTEGRLKPEIGPILSVVKKYNMVLANGHLSPTETFALVEEALIIGIRKFVITHPRNKEFSRQIFSIEELKQLARMGAFVEYTFICHLPTEFCHDPARTASEIREIGAEHCIISTDMGYFTYNPSPVEGYRMFISTLLRNGITPKEIELMAKVNPAKLLDLV